MKRIIGLGLVCVTLSGCAAMAVAPVSGLLSMDVRGPLAATSNEGGTKVGRACAKSVLGLVASGDASIEAARIDGGITTITSVDYESKSILGITASFCTVVRGH